jgi:hypothetical protein
LEKCDAAWWFFVVILVVNCGRNLVSRWSIFRGEKYATVLRFICANAILDYWVKLRGWYDGRQCLWDVICFRADFVLPVLLG